MIFLILLSIVLGVELINQSLWWWFYGRIGHRWNWRALFGPWLYLPWLYERLAIRFYELFNFDEEVE